jgi:hypothetical protein
MRLQGVQFFYMASFLVLATVLPANAGWAQGSVSEEKSSQSACSSAPQTDIPQATISNGQINAVVYLPDPKNGYYRSTRFDWAGVIPCLTYKGHNYFGVWFPHHDPLIADSVTGPVEEFRSDDGSLGYGAAKPNELFVKPGVGVLSKVDDSPYKYMFVYPIVDTGKWTVRTKKSEISFTQRLQSPVGYSYVYEKILRLDKHEPILVIEHHLKNVGTKTIDTDVYEHDFFMLDGAPTGPGMAIHFAFEPKAQRSLEPGAKIEGKDIVYQEELKPRQTVTSFLTGYSNAPSDYDFTFENRSTGAGVEQAGDSPMSNFNLWSIRTTVAPEAYVHLHILPGKTQSWNIRYRFFAK